MPRPVDAEVETAGPGSTAAETSAGDSPAFISRRRFVVGSVALAGAGALLAAGCGSAGSGGSGGNASPTPSAWFPVSISGLAAGEPRWVEFDVAGATTGAAVSPIAPSADATPADALPKTRGGAWLVKGSDGTLVAFAPNCTHQLCLYDWEAAEARFHCRCHPGFFGLDGKVLGGPPPRPLWRYDTRPGSIADTLEIGWHTEG